MQSISKLCENLALGKKLDQETQAALKNYLSDHSNAIQVLQAIIQSPYTLVCYKNFTLQSRRSGDYYVNIQGIDDEIRIFLEILSAAPNFQKEHECNILSSLQGEFLAECISYSRTVSPQFIDRYIRGILSLNKPLELKIHSALKIIISCLERIYEIRHYNGNMKIKGDLIYRYVQAFAKYIISIITEIGIVISNQIQSIQYPKKAIQNLQSAQQSFLLSVERVKDLGKKIILKQWEQKQYKKWVTSWCLILQAFIKPQIQIDSGRLEEMLQSSCRSITLIHEIYLVLGQSCTTQLWKSVVQNLLLQFITMFVQNQEIELDLPSQFHVAVLNLLREQEIINILNFLNEENQYKHLVLQWVINYCITVAKEFYYYFPNFYECPVGLSMVVIDSIVRHLQNNYNKIFCLQKEGGNLSEGQLHQSIVQFLKIYNHHEIWLKQIIDQKVFENCKFQQKEQFYQQGKDWKYFITQQLRSYFISFADHSPRFFKSLQFVYSQQNNPLDNFSHLLNNLDEQGTSGIDEEHLQLLKKNPAFQLLWNILNYLFQKFCSNNIYNSSPADQQKNSIDNIKASEESIFDNLMPVIAMSFYLTQKSVDSDIKNFFCYEIYSLAEDIGPYSYQFCREKAKLCKLFIYELVIDEIFNQSFQTFGLGQSSLFAYIHQKSNVSFQLVVDELVSKVMQCISIRQNQAIQENKDIIKYGIEIIQQLAKKISRRAIQQVQNKKKPDQYMPLSNALDIISEKVRSFDLLLMVPEFYKKIYGIYCQRIKSLYPKQAVSALNQIMGQTVENNQFNFIIHLEKNEINSVENLWIRKCIFFLNGVVGLISNLSKQECFKQVVQMVLNARVLQYIQINEFNYEVYLDFAYEIICPDKHLWYQISPQMCSATYSNIYQIPMQSNIGLLIHDVFWSRLPCLLNFCRQIPHLEEKCMAIYSNMPKYQAIMQLIPVPDGIDLNKYQDVLDSYFLFIDRLNDISPLINYYTYKVEWLTAFLEKQMQKQFSFQLSRQYLQTILMSMSNLNQISDLKQFVHLKLVLSAACKMSMENLNLIVLQCYERKKKLYCFEND